MQRDTPRRSCRRSSPWLLLLLGSCYRPEMSDCIRCSDRCPEGRACVDGWCTPKATSCGIAEFDAATALEEHAEADRDASEPPDAADINLLAPSMCRAGVCCIDDDACFALDPGAELALWLDWSSTTTEQGQFVAWRDRSGQGHDATSKRLKARPQVQSVGTGDASILSFAMADSLSVAEADGDALDLLFTDDFYALVAFASACPLSGSCLLGKHSQSEGLALGITQTGRLSSFLQCEKPADCKLPEDAPVSVRGCGKSSLFSARFAKRSASELAAEIRLEGQVVERRDFALSAPPTNSGPLDIGGGFSPQWKASGQLALVAVVRGALSAAQACDIERAAAEALVRAGIRTEPLRDCTLAAD
jgi:hypothetical protein